MNEICVNFDQATGTVRPLHSVCCAPYDRLWGETQPYVSRFFAEGNIPFCRLHDCCGAWGGSYFVDIANVFPDFAADENDPASYDFHYTDEYIGAIQATGCAAYYRLGETIEWGTKKYTAHPPRDFAKWARICEHIIRHYNEGWADGFHYDLTYWEIWNEPENPGKSQWTGTKEAFFELYEVASKHLKAQFPHIKVGGYGSCGFYAVTRKDIPVGYTDFVTWFTDFLVFVQKKECPLDFFSWHIYTADETELLTHARYVRETLDKNGLTHTESHLNEWNIAAEGDGYKEKHTAQGAAFNAAVLCMLQNTPYVDIAMYYCFSYLGRYNGFLDQNDGATVCPSWYPYVAFGNLYRMGHAVAVSGGSDGVYATAARNEHEYGILAANYRGKEEKTVLHITGVEGQKTAQVHLIDDTHALEEVFRFTFEWETKITFRLPRHTAAYITMG